MATINFTNYADNVYAYNYYGNNTYNLLRGEDYFDGSSNRDIVYGGDGADYIDGWSGNDTLYGGTGYDYLCSGQGFDRLFGDAGNDTLNSWDGDHDELYGGIGNDLIYADNDLVNAGDGNDKVQFSLDYGDNSTVTLGSGADTLDISTDEMYYGDYNTVKVLDFKAEDHLDIHGYDAYGTWYAKGAILDKLDANDDGWLGAKDVAADNPYDDFSVHVGSNFLELEVFDSSVIFQGMTQARFDFLA